MEQVARSFARKHLPDQLRKPLGVLGGWIHHRVLLPLEGTLFDLKGARFRAGSCTFRIPRDVTTRAFRSCFLTRDYERYEIELVPRYIRPDDHVLELGACMGIISCLTNSLLADKTRHVVVEANPFCIPTIYKNRESNKCAFLIEHCAVDDKPEITFFLHPRFIVGGNSQRRTEHAVRLPAKSLRQLVRERGPFTSLIIDIEGSERELLAESLDILQTLRLVIIELHDWAIGVEGVENCRKALRAAGLRLVESRGIVEVWERA